jgi:hypothetical protein
MLAKSDYAARVRSLVQTKQRGALAWLELLKDLDEPAPVEIDKGKPDVVEPGALSRKVFKALSTRFGEGEPHLIAQLTPSCYLCTSHYAASCADLMPPLLTEHLWPLLTQLEEGGGKTSGSGAS